MNDSSLNNASLMTTALIQNFVMTRLNLAWVDASPHLLFATNVEDEELRQRLRTAQVDHLNATHEIRETISLLISRWKTEFDKLEVVTASFQDVSSHNARLCIERARETGTFLNQNPYQERYLPMMAGLQCQRNYLSIQPAKGPLSRPVTLPPAGSGGARRNAGRKRLMPCPDSQESEPVEVLCVSPAPTRPTAEASKPSSHVTPSPVTTTTTPSVAEPVTRSTAWNSINPQAPAQTETSGSKRRRIETPEADTPDPAWLAAVAKQKAERVAKEKARLDHEARAQALAAAVDAPDGTEAESASASKTAQAPTRSRSGGIASWGRSVLASGAKLCI